MLGWLLTKNHSGRYTYLSVLPSSSQRGLMLRSDRTGESISAACSSFNLCHGSRLTSVDSDLFGRSMCANVHRCPALSRLFRKNKIYTTNCSCVGATVSKIGRLQIL